MFFFVIYFSALLFTSSFCYSFLRFAILLMYLTIRCYLLPCLFVFYSFSFWLFIWDSFPSFSYIYTIYSLLISPLFTSIFLLIVALEYLPTQADHDKGFPWSCSLACHVFLPVALLFTFCGLVMVGSW